jgi:LysR family transcriptional regulator for metE and metH
VDLEVRHLRLVAAIAEEGGVTRAGVRLHLTQSALSHQLRDIEDRLGTILFRRAGRRMVLTSAGARLLEVARDVLARLERTEEAIRRLGADCEGILRICTECYTCYHWLPALARSFAKRFPRVDVRIVLEATRRPLAALLDGSLDLAVVGSPVRSSRFACAPLFEDEFVLVVPPGHPLAARPYARPEDFAEETLFIYSTPEENTVIRKVLAPAGVAPAHVASIPLTEAILEHVKAGLGVAVMARWAVSPELRSGVLKGVPVTRRGLRRRWTAARLKAGPEPEYVKAFIALLAAKGLRAARTCARGASAGA